MKAYKQRSGFTKIPNSIYDVWGQILGPHVSFVYGCIVSHVNSKTQVGFPSYATIANKCGMTRRKAMDCVADLVFLEFLGKKACWHQDGDQDTNNYYVLDMPDIKDVIAKLLRDDVTVPKKHEWIIKNLKEYSSATMTKLDYEKLVDERNTGLDAGGVVNIVHYPGEYGSPGVVNIVHQGGEYGSPKTDIVNKTNIKQTYLHTEKSEKESQATNLDLTEKGVASDKPVEIGNNSEGETLIWGNLLMGDAVSTEKMLIRNELAKLLDSKLAQYIVDEVVTKYAAGKIKTSLATFAKGLVNKANKGEFAPTNNLSLKRAEKTQKAATAKSNTPAPNTPKNFVAAHTVIANLKQTIAGGRAKKTPEEQAEIDKALAEIAARR